MLGTTHRQRALAVTVLLIGTGTAAAALLDAPRFAFAGLAIIATSSVVLLLDLRTRQGALLKRITTMKQELTALRVRSPKRSATELCTMQERVAELKTELAAKKAELLRLDDLQTASYRQSLRQHVRVFRAEHRLKAPSKSAALQLPHKLRNLEFAASHGVAVPEVYQVWADIDSIDLTDLPDTFVLKADGGAGSVAVFPLGRIEGGRYQAIGSDGEYTEDEIRDRFRSLGRQARQPYFAEELLHAADGGPIPNDVKCYMFYGQVGQILVRNVGEHGDASTIRLKFVDEQGNDFGPVAVGRIHESSIAVPDSLSEMVSVAKHLSRAVGLPFCRVDLYHTNRGIVLGEITRAPSGGNERFVEAHDELLGKRWLQSSARLAADLSAGRPVGPLFGKVADLHLYPPTDSPRAVANLTRPVADCWQWCTDSSK